MRKDGKHSPPTAYWRQGPLKGQPMLCKVDLCWQPIQPNTNHLRLCQKHLREYKAESRSRLWHNSDKRLAACIDQLSWPHPMPGIMKRIGRFRALAVFNSFRSKKKHWQRLMAECPEKLPPGLNLNNLPR